jgi:hypothetical protein
MTNVHSALDELDEALVTGTRALEIAGRLGDLRLRILATTYLEQAHFYRGEYERVVELATDPRRAARRLDLRGFRTHRTGVGLRSLPARLEPRRGWEIRRSGTVRSRGD